ncbi:hypothetical protein [Actinoplanes friuliensis]|uniref:hypothetical protein n=1 Tax=Actinoplanes friuliensis TaxID=196914 RepID=UPI0011DD9D26|nr:hypothetical protein [Actinoplanes friuliensis]
MDEFSLRWRITGSGSATFCLDLREETVEIHTTYVGDGLGSVLQAALDLQGGSSSAIAFLPAEPGGSCLFFGGASSRVYLQIVDFQDMSSEDGRWGGGRLRWNGHVSVDRFVRQAATMAEDVLAEYQDAASYRVAWGGIPFPVDNIRRLRDRIGDDRGLR